MKKLLLFSIIIMFIFFGCTNSKIDRQSDSYITLNPSIILTDSPLPSTSINSTLPSNPGNSNSLNILYPAYTNMKFHNLIDWQVLINKKFGLNLYVSYKYMSPQEILGSSNNNTVIYLNFTKGYPYEFNTQVFSFSDDKITYDLSPYYLKYNWNEYMDSVYIETLKKNGKIFAIPASNEKYIIPRHYNKEYLAKLDIDVPTTVSELYSYLKSTKQMNSSDASFYPMCVFGPYITKSTADIFRAQGVYFNSDDNLTITYNPNTNSFEDGVYAENINAALGYIRTLQNEDLLLICGISYYENDNGSPTVMYNDDYGSVNKNFATEYGVLYVPEKQGFIREGTKNYNNTAYESLNGYYLIGTNIKNVCEVKSDLAFYVFPKNNESFYQTIDLFNTVFTQNDYYLNLRYGIDGDNFSINNDNIIITPPLTGAFLDLKSIANITDINTSLVPKSTVIIPNLSSDLWFEKNVFTMYRTYLEQENSLNAHSQQNLVGILFNETLSVSDSIEEYKNIFKKSGLKTIIDDLNNKLGTTSQYNYD